MHSSSEVLLADGFTVKKIKDITNDDSVMTINKETLQIEPSKIRDKFEKMPKKLLKVTTISGREIKCTPDHPLLVKNNGKYEMVEAGKLKQRDQLIIRHTQKYLSVEKETVVSFKSSDFPERHRDELIRLGFVDCNIIQEKLEILARLFGANITDGTLSKRKNSYECKFYVGELEDANDLNRDIQQLGFTIAKITRRSTKFENKSKNKQTINTTY